MDQEIERYRRELEEFMNTKNYESAIIAIRELWKLNCDIQLSLEDPQVEIQKYLINQFKIPEDKATYISKKTYSKTEAIKIARNLKFID